MRFATLATRYVFIDLDDRKVLVTERYAHLVPDAFTSQDFAAVHVILPLLSEGG